MILMSEEIDISSISMELSILIQLTVSNELLVTQLTVGLFLLRMHFISTLLTFLKLNECLFTYIFA